jgi:hypothetical protein
MFLAIAAAHADELPAMVNNAGNEIRWRAMPLVYKIDAANDAGIAPDRALASIRAAATPWSDVPESSIEFEYGGEVSGVRAGHDDTNAVLFAGNWDLDPDLLAVTSVWSTEDGTAVSFDMQINTMDHEWSADGADNAADLQNALAHEFGHALGIGHLDKSPDATMYPSAPDGETLKRDLSEDDQWVALNFYPEGGLAPIEEEGQFAVCGVASPMSAAAWIGGLLATATLARRRARGEA